MEKQCNAIPSVDCEQPLFSSLIRSTRKKKTLASEKMRSSCPQFSRGHFSLANVFFSLARRIELEKRGCS